MGSGLAQTHDQKATNPIQGVGKLTGNPSANSLTMKSEYCVPTIDGKAYLAAEPINLALKFKPPTIAVVYQMKNKDSISIGRKKKFIHEIKISFEQQAGFPHKIDLSSMCEDLCRRETTYLNPVFIRREQVSDLLNKLHDRYLKDKGLSKPQNEGDSAGKPANKPEESPEQPGGRKKNFFERKRFIEYEKTGEDKDDLPEQMPAVTKEVVDGKIVEKIEAPAIQQNDQLEDQEEEVMVVQNSRKKKTEAVKSAPPKKDKLKSEPPKEVKQEKPADLDFEDNYEEEWDDNKVAKQEQPSPKQLMQEQSKKSLKQSDKYSDDNDWDLDNELADNANKQE